VTLVKNWCKFGRHTNHLLIYLPAFVTNSNKTNVRLNCVNFLMQAYKVYIKHRRSNKHKIQI